MENLVKLYFKARAIFTPVRAIALISVILGLVDNLSNPIRHTLNNQIIHEVDPFVEWAVRCSFIFCGFFGLLGNGRTKIIRATTVSLPFLYLGIYYLIIYMEYRNSASFIPMFTTLILGLWTLFFGEHYE